MPATLTPKQMEFLKSIDTPTVCNIVEMVAPERRGHGYTVKHLFCPFPDLPPIVGFAKTVTAKAKDKVAAGDYMTKRMDYLDYVASEPRPSISVIEDLDDEVGYGAFWGEVQSNIHLALGCQGVITNGSIRDIPMIAKGFQMLAGSYAPSHAYTHVEDFGIDVTVHGMKVKSGDLIHADQHGAIVIPLNIIDKLPAALDEINAKEAKIIKAAKEVGTVEAIKAAIRGVDMLALRPNCECCDRDLPPESRDAMMCSFECTFCKDCAEKTLKGKCPNCGGELVRRPVRPADKLVKYPASTERKVKPQGCEAA